MKGLALPRPCCFGKGTVVGSHSPTPTTEGHPPTVPLEPGRFDQNQLGTDLQLESSPLPSFHQGQEHFVALFADEQFQDGFSTKHSIQFLYGLLRVPEGFDALEEYISRILPSCIFSKLLNQQISDT